MAHGLLLQLEPEKAKPAVKQGRKTTDLMPDSRVAQ